MTRTVPAIFENGVFRPTQPVHDLPDHAAVRLTIESSTPNTGARRVLGLQHGQVLHLASDFDAELGDEFWLGGKS